MNPVKREVYSVKTPERIIFGDPLYFEQFKGSKLEQLTVDVQPPGRFTARLALEEYPIEDFPDEMMHVMSLYLAPQATMDVYVRDQMYESQTCTNRDIGVDSASYCLKVNDRSETFSTGGDGYWGNYQVLSRQQGKKSILDAIILSIRMPENYTMEDTRECAKFFFKDMEQLQSESDFASGAGAENENHSSTDGLTMQ